MNARLWSVSLELSKLTIQDLTELEKSRPGAGVQLLQTGMLMRGLASTAHYDYLSKEMTSVSCDFPSDLGVKKIAFLDEEGNIVHEQGLYNGEAYVVRAKHAEPPRSRYFTPYCDLCESYHNPSFACVDDKFKCVDEDCTNRVDAADTYCAEHSGVATEPVSVPAATETQKLSKDPPDEVEYTCGCKPGDPPCGGG